MLDATTQVVPNTTEPVANHLRCGSRWICCQTHPQAERWALANLERQGYRCFLPLVWTTRRDRATPTLRHRVQAPLFTSYLFVVVDSHWAPVAHTRGVRRLLMADGKPGYVNAGAVEAVQAAVALAAATTQETTQWAPGTPCSLATGAFHGLPAVVTEVHASNATIAIMMLGHLRTISVPLDCLRARDE